MKLYLIPDACSLAVHIVLRELHVDVELVRVNSRTKMTAEGRNFLEVNPSGYVAALELDSGEILTEVTAILIYLASTYAGGQLLPERSALGDYQLQRWMNYISSELQARFDLFFLADMPEQAKAIAKSKIISRLDGVSIELQGREYLLGGAFSIADCYLFTILRWSPWFDIDLSQWPSITGFVERIGARESAQKALQAEALLEPVV